MSKQLFLSHFFSKKLTSTTSSDPGDEDIIKKENTLINNIDHTEEKVKKVTLSNDVTLESTIDHSVATSSDYERLRQENMKRNADFLQSLGLHGLKPTIDVLPLIDKAKKRKCKTDILPPSQLRRSSRTTAGVVSYAENVDDHRDVDGGANDADSDADDAEEEEVYVDAPGVYKYIVSSSVVPATSVQVEAEAALGRCAYHLVDEPLCCEDLAATYSLEFHPNINGLLLAAGKGGYFSLMQTEKSEPKVIACSKIHSRWISTAKFSSFSKDNELSMLTASDDGTIRLWDLTKKNIVSEKPKLVTTAEHIHTRGIFALDEASGKILSGSKDKYICVSEVSGDGRIDLLQQYLYHSGVVKSVSWKSGDFSPNIFLSGGQDNKIFMKDIRTSGEAENCNTECFQAGVHTVAWNNTSGNSDIFLVAGLGPIVKVYDSRKFSTSLYELRGHCNPNLRRYNTISTPKFISSDVVLCIGEGSDDISLYSLKTGETMVRGKMPFTPMACAVNPCIEKNVNIRDSFYRMAENIVVAEKKCGNFHSLYL